MDEGALREGIAIAVRSLRSERRWTQRELCRRANLSPAYLSEIEAGRKDASAEVLERLAIAFDVKMDELLWCILLSVANGEIPGVQQRDAALRIAREMIGAEPGVRRDIEQFIAFRRWQTMNEAGTRNNSNAQIVEKTDGDSPM